MFSGCHLVRSVILLRVRWPKISASPIWKMMAERGMRVDLPTFHRRAVRFLPLLLKRFTRRSA